MATIQNTAGMSLQAIAQQLTPGATPQQELRSKGNDLYVKQGTKFFTDVQSRTDHRNSALALVKGAIERDLGIDSNTAQKFMSRVMTGQQNGQTGQITTGDLARLNKAVDLAGHFSGSPGTCAFRGSIAESLVHMGLTEAAAVDIVKALGGNTTRDLFRALEANDMARLAQLVGALPNTPETVDALQKIEAALVAKADGNDLSHPALTPPCHRVFYTKRTEALENVIQGKLQLSGDLRLTATLARLPKQEYWRLLMDGRHHGNGDKHFFDRSKGYMGSMMAGLNHIVDTVGTPLSPAYIQSLHTVSTTSVTKEMRTDDAIPLSKTNNMFQLAGVVKQAPNTWGVCSSFTDDGMRELLAIRQDLQAQLPLGSPPFFTDDQNAKSDNNRPGVVQAWKAGNPGDPNLPQTVNTLVQYAVDQGARDLAAARSDDEKLGAIIDTCRRLGSIHPFEDANGRLMMFLVLNKLLLDNGFSPTILQDQGHMIGKSRDELIVLIKAGQAQLDQLLH